MPIQRTLSPVPPLGKKTTHPHHGDTMMKMPFTSLTNADVSSPYIMSKPPNGLTSTIVTPTSLSNASTPNSAMSGIMTDFNTLLIMDDNDTDDESISDRGVDTLTDHKKLFDSGKTQPEPLLTPNPRRFVLFPIQDNEVCTCKDF